MRVDINLPSKMFETRPNYIPDETADKLETADYLVEQNGSYLQTIYKPTSNVVYDSNSSRTNFNTKANFNSNIELQSNFLQNGQHANLVSHIVVEIYNNGSLAQNIHRDTGGIVSSLTSGEVSVIFFDINFTNNLDTTSLGSITDVPLEYSFTPHVTRTNHVGPKRTTLVSNLTTPSSLRTEFGDDSTTIVPNSGNSVIVSIDIYKYAALNANDL